MKNIPCLARYAFMLAWSLYGGTIWVWKDDNGKPQQLQPCQVYTKDGLVAKITQHASKTGDEDKELFTLYNIGTQAVIGGLLGNNAKQFDHFTLELATKDPEAINAREIEFPDDKAAMRALSKGLRRAKFAEVRRALYHLSSDVEALKSTLKRAKAYCQIRNFYNEIKNADEAIGLNKVMGAINTFATRNIEFDEGLLALLVDQEDPEFSKFVGRLVRAYLAGNVSNKINKCTPPEDSQVKRIEKIIGERERDKQKMGFGFNNLVDASERDEIVNPKPSSYAIAGLFGLKQKDVYINGYGRSYWGASQNETSVAATLSLSIKAQSMFEFDYSGDMLNGLTGNESKCKALLHTFKNCYGFGGWYKDKGYFKLQPFLATHEDELKGMFNTDFMGVYEADVFAKIVNFDLSITMTLKALANWLFICPARLLFWAFTQNNARARKIKWNFIIPIGSLMASAVLGGVLGYIVYLIASIAISKTWMIFTLILWLISWFVGYSLGDYLI